MQLSAKEKKRRIDKINSFITEGTSHCEDKHKRCEEAQRYVGGMQWSEGDLYRQMLRERPAVPFNSIKKAVEAVANREIVERYVPKVFGRDASDSGIANLLDEACRWQRDVSETEHVASMAVRAMVMGGYGCMHKYWDDTAQAGNGMIVDEDVPIWNMLWPARARQMNLADRRWHVCGKWIPKDEAEAMWGDVSRQAANFFKKGSVKSLFADTASPLDNTFRRFGALSWMDIKNGQWISMAQDEIFVVESEWIENESFFRVAYPTRFDEVEAFVKGEAPSIQIENPQQDPNDPNSQPAVDIPYEQYAQMQYDQQKELLMQALFESEIQSFDDRSQINDFVKRYYEVTGDDFTDYRKVMRDVIRFGIVTQDILWDSGDRPYGFSYEFLTGWPVETRVGVDFIGMVDVAKGPQDYKNALMSNMLAMYMSSPKQPLIIEEGAVENIDTFIDQLSRPSGVATVPEGFIASNRYMTLQSPSFPPMAQELLQITSNAVDETFGLSSVDQGMQGDLRRVSGTVVQAAKTASNTIVALLFDSIRRFRRRFGLLNVKFIQDRYSPTELIRIVGSDKAADLESVTDWGETNRFDIKIDEEPVSATERIELIDKLTRTGDLGNWVNQKYITFETMVELLPYIPESVKRRIKEDSKREEQFQQELQQKDDQLKQMGDQLAAWNAVVETVPQSQAIKQQFEAVQAIHQLMMDNQQQQQNPEQPTQ